MEVHTLGFVVNELKSAQQRDAVQRYIDGGKLIVKKLNPGELSRVIELQTTTSGNLSIIDCAVWHYAKENGYVLLTGDRQLRNKAIDSGVTVRGILYVFDRLVEQCLISPSRAIAKLNELYTVNSRLPKSLIEERIEHWNAMLSGEDR